MRTKALLHLSIAMLTFTLIIGTASAATRTWQLASGEGDWFDPLNWDGQTTVPAAGDDVVVNTPGTVLLTNSTPALASLSLVGTLMFTNWNTTVNATDVTIASGGKMTMPAPFTDTQMSNNIVVVCSNFTVANGGLVDANYLGYAGRAGNGYGKGFLGGVGEKSDGFGPGRGFGNANQQSSGAGYGGHGGRCNFSAFYGADYGSSNAPALPGSGGGYGYGRTYELSGRGGGLIAIEARGSMTINGVVTANGEPWGSQTVYNTRSGGSGGGIHLRCDKLLGSGAGIIRANGGTSGGSDGAGGGGRVAIWRVEGDELLFATSAAKGTGGYAAGGVSTMSQDGTVVWGMLNPERTLLIVR